MKTKKILGLGICALSLGMVAGVIGTRAAVETKAGDVTAGWYLTGLDGWTPGESLKADATPAAGDAATWTNVELSKDNEFKLAYAQAGASAFNGDSWKGMSQVTSYPDGFFEDNGDGNIGAKYAGLYDIHLHPSDPENPESAYAITINVVIDSWGLVGSGNSWSETPASTFTYDSEKGVYTLEYDATVDEQFKVRANGKWASEGGVELWWQFCNKFNQSSKLVEYNNNAQFKVAKTFVLTIKDTLTAQIAADYQKVGDYIDVSIKGEEPEPSLPDGYYIVGVGGKWDKSGAIASDEITGEHAGDKYIKTNLALAHGTEFKIVGIKDGAIDWNDKIAVEPTKSEEGNDQSANFVTANDKNGGVNVKAIAFGTFDIYVNSEGAIYVFGATTGRTAAEEVDQFIDDFVAPNVTSPDDKGKYADWETCDDKYTTAKKVLERLSSGAQSLFLTNLDVSEKIQAARAAYKYWEVHKDDGTGSYNVAGLVNSNPTLIITLSVIAGAAVAGAGIYLISKKRKHN